MTTWLHQMGPSSRAGAIFPPPRFSSAVVVLSYSFSPHASAPLLFASIAPPLHHVFVPPHERFRRIQLPGQRLGFSPELPAGCVRFLLMVERDCRRSVHHNVPSLYHSHDILSDSLATGAYTTARTFKHDSIFEYSFHVNRLGKQVAFPSLYLCPHSRHVPWSESNDVHVC